MKINRFLDFTPKDIKYYIILISAPILLTIYRYHGYPGTNNLYKYLNFPKDQSQAIVSFMIFFVITFLIPIIYLRIFTTEKITDYGLSLGNYKYGIKSLLLIPLVILPAIYFAAKMPDVHSEYPLAKSLLIDQKNIFIYEITYVIFYYIAWEFYFRGFILFGLKDRFGDWNAILIQTISSCLIHIGKPEGEIIGSIVVGIIFGYIALRSRSIWYVFLMHASIGVLTDIFIIFGK